MEEGACGSTERIRNCCLETQFGKLSTGGRSKGAAWTRLGVISTANSELRRAREEGSSWHLAHRRTHRTGDTLAFSSIPSVA